LTEIPSRHANHGREIIELYVNVILFKVHNKLYRSETKERHRRVELNN